MIKKCKICNRMFAVPNVEARVYHNSYDHNACEDCNHRVSIGNKCRHSWHWDSKTSFAYCAICLHCIKDGVMMSRDEYIAKYMHISVD